VSDAKSISAFVKRVSRSPLEQNRDDLLAGRRWNLLQAVAWIASENRALVAEVGSWCPPANALPHENAAQGAALELEERLRTKAGLTFQRALIKLLNLLNRGSVMIYVDHLECMPLGLRFQALRYHRDMIGLSPSPDDRYWGYVVVDADSLRQAWDATKRPITPRDGASSSDELFFDAPPPLVKERGRPRKYDWTGAETALMELDGSDDVIASVISGDMPQAKLERYMASWFAKRGNEPGESSIRNRISKLIAHRREVNAQKGQ